MENDSLKYIMAILRVHNEGDSLILESNKCGILLILPISKKISRCCLGLGTDDTHNYHQFGPTFSNAGRGWVMVFASSLEPHALIDAMERGDFYASSGVTLNQVKVLKNEISLDVKSEPGVNYTIEFVGVVKGSERPTVLKRIAGTSGKFKITSQHAFVRARVISSKAKPNSPYNEGEFEMAWTQPILFQ